MYNKVRRPFFIVERFKVEIASQILSCVKRRVHNRKNAGSRYCWFAHVITRP